MPMPKCLEGKAVNIMDQPNRGKGAGRKPKLIRKWIKDCNVSKGDAQAILKNLLVNYTLTGLEKLKKSERDQVSVLTFTLLEEVIRGAKKGDFSITRDMLEFLFGKEEQTINVHDGRLVDLKNLLVERSEKSPEERERIIAELERAIGNQE
jgi:hypothetical protein